MKKSCLEGCFCSKAGFTLIELLVVVLIIGILAAVAVPQYQKAVDRSRAAQTVQLINSLKQAAEVWMLAHPGEEAFFLTKNSTDSLDIDIPCEYDQHNRCNVGTDRLQVEVFADGTAVVYVYHYYVSNANVTIASQYQNGTWTNKCGYFDDRGKAICEGLQGYEAIENFDI